MGTLQPSISKGRNPVHAGKQLVGLLARARNRRYSMDVITAAGRSVARESVGENSRTRLAVCEQERPQRWHTRVVNDSHPTMSKALVPPLYSDLPQGFPKRYDLARPVLDLRGTHHRPRQSPTVGLGQLGPSRCGNGAAWPRRFGWNRCQAHASGRARRYPACRSSFATLRRTGP